MDGVREAKGRAGGRGGRARAGMRDGDAGEIGGGFVAAAAATASRGVVVAGAVEGARGAGRVAEGAGPAEVRVGGSGGDAAAVE